MNRTADPPTRRQFTTVAGSALASLALGGGACEKLAPATYPDDGLVTARPGAAGAYSSVWQELPYWLQIHGAQRGTSSKKEGSASMCITSIARWSVVAREALAWFAASK